LAALSPVHHDAPPARPAGPAFVRRWLAVLLRLEGSVAIACLCTASAVILIDCLGRELLQPLARAAGLGRSLELQPGLSRYALYAILVATFAGFSVASATGAHLGSGLGQLALPSRLSRWRERLGDLLTGLVFAAAAWYGMRFVQASFESGARASFLSWPVWPIQAVMPLAMASSGLRFLCFAAWPGLRPAGRGALT
jgi:TRAP-type C4-dicarboxylate transport system permease small subunit